MNFYEGIGFKYPEVDEFSKKCVEVKKTIEQIKSYTL
jgi:hypothetical protein